MKLENLLNTALIIGVLVLGANSFSEETSKEKLETMSNETKDGTKKAYRNAQGKYCDWVDGKIKCLGKKIVHKTKNTTEKIKTKSTELKNKVD